MASTLLLRLLPLLLVLLPPPLREYLSGSLRLKNAGVGDLHPLVVVPGVSCSDLEARFTEAYRPSVPRCGAMKGKGWFGLWENSSELLAHDYVQCFQEQMRLVYDLAINHYRNLPGVETRVPRFGIARGFHEKNPSHPEWCLTKLIEALETMLSSAFGAPYDIRYVPPIPGQPSQVYSATTHSSRRPSRQRARSTTRRSSSSVTASEEWWRSSSSGTCHWSGVTGTSCTSSWSRQRSPQASTTTTQRTRRARLPASAGFDFGMIVSGLFIVWIQQISVSPVMIG